MIVIGVDAHKLTHTLVAVDANGRIIGERVVEARPSGHSEAIGWARASYGAMSRGVSKTAARYQPASNARCWQRVRRSSAYADWRIMPTVA